MSTFDVLAVHEVRATYKGTSRRPCRFMTSLCPDRCNHSKDVASFAVDEYVNYSLNGKYGDEKQDTIYFAFPNEGDGEANNSEWQPAEFKSKVRALHPGDKVIIRYEHRHMKGGDGGSWGARPFTKLERL